MKIKEWMLEHQKKLSLGIGALLIAGAAAMLFWDNRGEGVVSEEEAYAQKVAAMEARMSGGAVPPPVQQDQSAIMKGYKEKQALHLRYTLIVMMIGGIIFLVYGFIKKAEEE